MSSKSRNVLNDTEIERELDDSETDFENYDSDSDPEFLITEDNYAMTNSSDEENIITTNYESVG